VTHCALSERLQPPATAGISVEIRTGDRPLVIEIGDGPVAVRPGAAEHANVVISGPPRVVPGLLLGRLPLAAATRRGLTCDGQADELARLRPATATNG
jgi:hypothetical protein